MTLERAKIENNQFNEGDKVIVKWPGFPTEEAVVTKICTYTHGGYEVVSAILIQTEKSEKSFGVCPSILHKVN